MSDPKRVEGMAAKCEIRELLGAGTFGKVYKAVYQEDGKTYALKTLKFTDDRHEFYAVSEAEVQELMKHPNIVRLVATEIDIITKTGILPARGGELFSELTKYREQLRNYMPRERIRSYFMQLVFALHYMHDATERGDKTKKGAYVHQDLKPENIFFADKEKTMIKIGDFGLARYQQPGQKFTSTAGTWRYHAPEIFNEEPFNEKVDIWALGCITYEMLNNIHPFPAEFRRTAQWIHGSDSDFLRAGRDRDAELADLIDKMLVADPDKRISTAELLQQPMLRAQRLETLLRKNNLEARTCRQKLEREREEHRQQLKRELDDHKLQLATQAKYLRHLEDRGARMQEAERRNAAKLEQSFTVEVERRLAEQLALRQKPSQVQLEAAHYQGELYQLRRVEARQQGVPAHAQSPVKANGQAHHGREKPMRASSHKFDTPVVTTKLKPLERNVHSDGDIWKRSAYPLAVASPEKVRPSPDAYHI